MEVPIGCGNAGFRPLIGVINMRYTQSASELHDSE